MVSVITTRERLQAIREREIDRLAAGPPVCIRDDGTWFDVTFTTDFLQAIDRALAKLEFAAL